MAHYSAKPLRVDLRPSAWLAASLLAMIMLCLGALLSLPWPWWGRLPLAVGILVAARHAVRLHARLTLAHAIVAIAVDGQGKVNVQQRDGNRLTVQVQADSVVNTWLIVLALRLPGRHWRRYVVLLADSAAPEQLRQLRVWLRWGWQARSDADLSQDGWS